MAKPAKARATRRQGNKCALTGVELKADPSLNDQDRIVPRAAGGTYTDENTRATEPRAHMSRHGILRERDELHTKLKDQFDRRRQMMKNCNQQNNSILAILRHTDSADPEMMERLTAQRERAKEWTADYEGQIIATVKQLALTDPLVAACEKLKYLGPMTIAALTVYVDLAGVFPEKDGDGKPHPRAGQEKAPTASSLWKYCGLDKPGWMRYEKGKTSGGNKTLRTALWNSAMTFMKGKGPYRDLYDRERRRRAASQIMVKSRNTAGILKEMPWSKTKDGHQHDAALRAIMKQLLAHYWFVGRTLAGLSTRSLYVEEKLGHTVTPPEEWGWIYVKPPTSD